MSIVEQIIVGFSIIVLIFSSIIILALKKPLKLWSVSAFAVGVQLLIYYPEQRIFAFSLILLSILYFIRANKIFAYRKKNVLIESGAESSLSKKFLTRLGRITKRELAARLMTLAAAVLFINVFFSFREFAIADMEYFSYTAFVIIMILYVWEFFNIVMLSIVAPVFVIKEEVRAARLKDALIIERNIGKGILIGEPCMFFEKDEYYVSFRRYAEEIGEIAGCLCEYTVYTDMLGNEFIRVCPLALSSGKEFTQLVYPEDLHYIMGRRLQYRDNSKKSILPFLLGFILPVILISFTMLVLFLLI